MRNVAWLVGGGGHIPRQFHYHYAGEDRSGKYIGPAALSIDVENKGF